MDPAEYWKTYGAPKVRARKAEIGRELTNEAIAEAIERLSGKRTTRKAFENFMNGIREPYVSQLMALCSIMELRAEEFFQAAAVVKREPLVHRREGRRTIKVSRQKIKNQTAG